MKKSQKKSYEEMISRTPIQEEGGGGLSITVAAPVRASVEIRTVMGYKFASSCSGCCEFNIYLSPKEVDELIDRLVIAKEFLLEQQEAA